MPTRASAGARLSVGLLNLTYSPGTGGIDSYFHGLAKGNPHISFEVFAGWSDISPTHLLPNVTVVSIDTALGLPRTFITAASRVDLLLWILVRLASRRARDHDLLICRHPAFHFSIQRGPRLFLFATALPAYLDSVISNGNAALSRRLYARWRAHLYGAVERRILSTHPAAVLSKAKRRELATSYSVPESGIGVVPPGVDSGHYSLVNRSVPEPPAPLEIACVGRLSPEKNQMLLVDLAKASRGRIRVHLVGDGPDRGRLEAAAADNPDSIVFHGFQSDIRPILACCHIFCLPSVYEGFGHVLLEAMATGLPCVALDPACGFNVASTEVITPGVDGLLTDNNVAAVTSAIAALVSDATAYRRYQENARIKAERFSWQNHLQELFELTDSYPRE